jgi:hypothetical protein
MELFGLKVHVGEVYEAGQSTWQCRGQTRRERGGGVHEIESEVQRSSFERSLNLTVLSLVSTTTYMKTRKVRRKPMQGLDGVPSRPFACCLVALALPSLLWPLCQWGKRVTAPWVVLQELAGNGSIPTRRTVSDRIK